MPRVLLDSIYSNYIVEASTLFEFLCIVQCSGHCGIVVFDEVFSNVHLTGLCDVMVYVYTLFMFFSDTTYLRFPKLIKHFKVSMSKTFDLADLWARQKHSI